MHYIYYVLYSYYYYYISSTPDHQVLDPRGWGSLMYGTSDLKPGPDIVTQHFSRVSHSWVAELTFSFDSDSFFNSASYFCTLLGFDSVSYMHRNRKNSLDFLFSSPSSTEWHMIGFSISRFTLEFVSLMVICHSVEEGEENKKSKLFFLFLCT